MREFTVSLQDEHVITDQLIADWVVTAFEGGITYWCHNVECVERDKNGLWQEIEGERYDALMIDGCGPYVNPDFWSYDQRGYRLYDPYEEAWVPKVLTMSALLKALKYQPPKSEHQSPNWFRKTVRSLIDEDYDAGDADTLVQVAVFGELVYG